MTTTTCPPGLGNASRHAPCAAYGATGARQTAHWTGFPPLTPTPLALTPDLLPSLPTASRRGAAPSPCGGSPPRQGRLSLPVAAGQVGAG